MKKVSKILFGFTVLTVIISICNFANASTLSEMMDQANNFVQAGQESAGTEIDYNEAVTPIAAIGSILTTVGVAVMLGATAYMGIKYLVSGPDARAKLKQQLIGLVVSGVVIFGAYYIWKIVIDLGEKLT